MNGCDRLVRYMVQKSYHLDDATNPDGTEPSIHPGFSTARIHMPCRFKGTGFTLASDRRYAVFANSLIMSIPQMICTDGRTPGYYEFLRSTLDHPDPTIESAFKDFDKPDLLPHWAPFFASGSRIGERLRQSFFFLRERQSNMTRPEQAEEVLCESLQGNEDTTKPVNTKSFQKAVTHTFYKLKYQLLCDQANELDDNDPRRLAFTNSDVFSAQLFSAYPTNEFAPTSLVFREACCTLLGLPSLVCRHHVGQQIRTSPNSPAQRVDRYGLILTQVNRITGSSRTPLHNAIQKLIASLLKRYGYTVTENPVDLFVSLTTEPVMQAIMNGELDAPQTTIIPDLAFRSPLGHTSTVIDFKTLSDSQAYQQTSAVNTRASRVPLEYKAAARKIDTVSLGYPPTHTRPSEEIGPLEAEVGRANVEGLVFGRYSETSGSVSKLIKGVAEERSAEAMRSMGCETVRHAQQVIKEMFRKKLGLLVSIEWAKLRLRVFHHAVSRLSALADELVDEGEEDYILLRNPGLNGGASHSWRH